MRRIIVLALLIASLLPAVEVHAGQFTIYEENDTFGLDSPSDRHYTQGLRLEYAWHGQSPLFLARAFDNLPLYRNGSIAVAEALGIAQNMYTPEIITDPVYNPYDRPFAAWMYATYKTFILDTLASEWQDTYELDLGVVGPWAQGDEIQSGFHDLIGDEDDPTWVNEIPNQVVVLLGYSRKWAVTVNPSEVEGERTWPVYLMPAATIRVGNVMTDVGLGATFLAGYHTPLDFAAGTVSPSVFGTEDPGQFRLYAHASIDGRFVAFNASLDGTAFRDESASIERNELVADYKLGITGSWKQVRLSFIQVWRTPEIETRSNFQNYGAIQIGIGNVIM